MNKKLFLIPALATLLFSSCSSDDAPGDASVTTNDGDKYLAVSITTGGGLGIGGRADGDAKNFEESVGNECTIDANSIRFFFYDAQGNPFPLATSGVNGTVTSNVVRPADITDNNAQHGDGSATDNSIKAVLVLGKAVGEGYVGTKPSKVLVIANPSTSVDVENKYVNTPLSIVLQNWSSTPTGGIPATTGFVITSSTYVDGNGKIVTAQDVTGHFADTPAAAEANPVVLYMERLAAKVRVKGLAEYDPQFRNSEGALDATQTGKIKINGAETNVKVELQGWELIKFAGRSSTFKNLLETWLTDAGKPFADWNDALRHRSYWANSNHGTIRNTEIPELTDASKYTNGNFDSNTPTQNIAYCYENTGYTPASVNDRSKANLATAIVVKAVVKTVGADGTTTPVDLVRWAGSYYTLDQIKEKIAQDYNGQHSGSSPATKDHVFFIDNSDASDNSYHAVVTIDGDTKNMANFQNILWWENGTTSYYVNIEHLGGKFGVVRNHIYEYVFDGVIGLGVPGEEPDSPVETESFLSAKLYCLNWLLVSKNITLE